jgi:hypothetical protein
VCSSCHNIQSCQSRPIAANLGLGQRLQRFKDEAFAVGDEAQSLNERWHDVVFTAFDEEFKRFALGRIVVGKKRSADNLLNGNVSRRRLRIGCPGRNHYDNDKDGRGHESGHIRSTPDRPPTRGY